MVATLAGISTLFGLLAVLGYLYQRGVTQRAQRSVADIFGNQKFSAADIASVLRHFKSDDARLKALRQMMNEVLARKVLDKVNSGIDIEKLSEQADNRNLRVYLVGAVLFLGLAAVGGLSVLAPSPKQSDVKSGLVQTSENSPSPYATSSSSEVSENQKRIDELRLRITAVVGEYNNARTNQSLAHGVREKAYGLLQQIEAVDSTKLDLTRALWKMHGRAIAALMAGLAEDEAKFPDQKLIQDMANRAVNAWGDLGSKASALLSLPSPNPEEASARDWIKSAKMEDERSLYFAYARALQLKYQNASISQVNDDFSRIDSIYLERSNPRDEPIVKFLCTSPNKKKLLRVKELCS